MSLFFIFLQESAASPNAGQMQVFLLVGIVAIFYFLIIRPQQKKQKKQKEPTYISATLNADDKVHTPQGNQVLISQNNETEVEEMIENPICPVCYTFFSTGSRFCNTDGSKLISSQKLIPKCVICGKEYAPNIKFCSDDGGQVISEIISKGKDVVNNEIKSKSSNNRTTGGEVVNSPKRATFFSLGLLISFFLPWFDLLLFRLSGFKIPIAYDSLGNIGVLFGNNMSYMKVTYLLYLLPCCALYNIFIDFLGHNKSYFLNEFVIGLIFSVIILIIIVSNDVNLSFLGVGFYSTCFFSVLGILFNDRNGFKSRNT